MCFEVTHVCPDGTLVRGYACTDYRQYPIPGTAVGDKSLEQWRADLDKEYAMGGASTEKINEGVKRAIENSEAVRRVKERLAAHEAAAIAHRPVKPQLEGLDDLEFRFLPYWGA